MSAGLYIQSIFNSIDGEYNGFQGAGQLCTFIRLKGCNLRCSYCDTDYAQSVDKKDVPVDVETVLNWPDMLDKITITGGEPLLQRDIGDLVFFLLKKDKKITIETNGTCVPLIFPNLSIENLRYVVDYKLPSSGMEDKMNFKVFKSLRSCDVVKFVIADFDDYYVARGLSSANWSKARKVFSPAIVDQNNYTNWPAALAQLMIGDAKVLGNVQFSLQIHKVLWPNAKVER